MARPLQQLGIAGLEDLFVKSEGGLQVLRDLEYELRHRQVPRARSLLVKVRAAIKSAANNGDWRCCCATPAGVPRVRWGVICLKSSM